MANESLLIKEAVQTFTARQKRTEKASDLVIQWAKNLEENDSWPKGKSLKGFEKWLRSSYRKAQDEAKKHTQRTGLKHEAGHGEQGANAPSNLSNQIKKGRFGNRTTNDRITGEVVKKSTEHLRIKDDLDAADIVYKMEKAFEEYLHEGNPNLKIEDQKQFTAKQKEAILHRPDYAPTAESAQMKARRQNLEAAFKKATEEHPIPKSHLKIVDQQMDAVLQGHRSRVTTPRSLPKPSVKQQVLKIIKNNGDNGNGNGNGVNGKNGKNGKLNGITTGSGKARLVDSALQIGTNVATGNYAGAAIGAGTLAGSQVLQNSVVQKRVAQQITKLIAERGAKSAAKLVPGLDIALSGKESWDYLRQGKLDQAGIAALSGAIGWLPLVGDGISAALDLSNTGLDIARLQVPNKRARRKLKVKTL